MARKRHKPEEIVSKLRQVDVLVSQGQNVVDAIRQIGVTEVTYYRWRQEFGGLKSDQVKRLKNLEAYRCALRPVHPARRSRAPSLGQRTGVRRQGRARLDRGCRSEGGLYRAGQPLGERLHRELQRSAPGRAAGWGDFLFARGGQDRGRKLAAPLQRQTPARVTGLQASSA